MDTFVLRIWTPADEPGGPATHAGTHGTVHHVGTGRSGVFRNDEQLLGLLVALRKQSAEDRGLSQAAGMPAVEQNEEAVR